MQSNNKNEYYILDLNDKDIEKINKTSTFYVFISLIFYLPFFILVITPGIGFLNIILNNYELNFTYIALYFLSFFTLGWNLIQSFFSYKIKNKIEKKNAPVLGFDKMPYMGLCLAVLFTGILFLFSLVLFIINLFYSQSFDITGLISLLCLAGSCSFSVFYFLLNFRTNRNAELIVINTNNENKLYKESTTKLFHSLYGLTEEEKYQGKNEFQDNSDEDKK